LTKTALDAQDHVAWEYRKDISSLILELKQQGYQIVVLEQTDQSVSVEQFRPIKPICLVVGHEVTGVCDKVVDLADAAVEIEMAGVKNSLNVAVAFGVAAYSLKSVISQKSSI
jgi:tRNA G18 (ribose-2'-O)-methylase SpoU